MSMTWESQQLHAQYDDADRIIKEAVDAAYDAVRLEFTTRGFDVSNTDPAEELVAHIYKYLIDSAVPTKPNVSAPVIFKTFTRMDEAVAVATPEQYIVFGQSIATGTEMYFVIDDLQQVAGRKMVVMQSPAGLKLRNQNATVQAQ